MIAKAVAVRVEERIKQKGVSLKEIKPDSPNELSSKLTVL
jgi:hypothetical protein